MTAGPTIEHQLVSRARTINAGPFEFAPVRSLRLPEVSLFAVTGDVDESSATGTRRRSVRHYRVITSIVASFATGEHGAESPEVAINGSVLSVRKNLQVWCSTDPRRQPVYRFMDCPGDQPFKVRA